MRAKISTQYRDNMEGTNREYEVGKTRAGAYKERANTVWTRPLGSIRSCCLRSKQAACISSQQLALLVPTSWPLPMVQSEAGQPSHMSDTNGNVDFMHIFTHPLVLLLNTFTVTSLKT